MTTLDRYEAARPVDIFEVRVDTDRVGQNRHSAAAYGRLRRSIQDHGLLTPIDLGTAFKLRDGLHRLSVYQDLYEETGDPRWRKIPAYVRAASVLEDVQIELDLNTLRVNLDSKAAHTLTQRAAELARDLMSKTGMPRSAAAEAAAQEIGASVDAVQKQLTRTAAKSQPLGAEVSAGIQAARASGDPILVAVAEQADAEVSDGDLEAAARLRPVPDNGSTSTPAAVPAAPVVAPAPSPVKAAPHDPTKLRQAAEYRRAVSTMQAVLATLVQEDARLRKLEAAADTWEIDLEAVATETVATLSADDVVAIRRVMARLAPALTGVEAAAA